MRSIYEISQGKRGEKRKSAQHPRNSKKQCHLSHVPTTTHHIRAHHTRASVPCCHSGCETRTSMCVRWRIKRDKIARTCDLFVPFILSVFLCIASLWAVAVGNVQEKCVKVALGCATTSSCSKLENCCKWASARARGLASVEIPEEKRKTRSRARIHISLLMATGTRSVMMCVCVLVLLRFAVFIFVSRAETSEIRDANN